MQNISTIDRLRQAITSARQLDSEIGAGTDADNEVLELRAKIENCQDEIEAMGLLKKLAPLEQTSKLRQIRKTRLQNDSATAWDSAASLARPAIDEAGEAVGNACGDSWEVFRELVVSSLAPEALQLAETSPQIAYAINSSKDGLASYALSVAGANLCQNELALAGRRDHYSTARQHAENALAVIDTITARLPEISHQADLLQRAAAAFAAVLAADSRQAAA